MKSSKFTNLTILLLLIFAVYQTGQLWLSGTSDHSFFEVFARDALQINKQPDENALLATRYAVGDGEGFFSLYYPDNTETNNVLKDAKEVLNETLTQNDVTLSTSKVDWKELLNSRCVVLQYDFMVLAEDYFENYKRLKAHDSLQMFDYITIVPSRGPGDETKIYFVNSETSDSLCFITNKSQSAAEFYKKLVVDENEISYISTGQKTGSSILWRNLFLPQWAKLPFAYKPLNAEFAFEKNGDVNIIDLENTVKGFFKNFSVDWSSKDDANNFVFSDNNTVVKYLVDEQVLEYYNYESYGNENGKHNLLNGYQICCNFLKSDSSLKTNIYLSNIEKKTNETVYYFDYVVDNFPITFSKALKEKIGMEHPIEITIRNQSVKKYKRYAINYSLSQNRTKELDVPFIDALDEANKTYQATVEERVITDVKNISLGYYADTTGEIELKWFVTLYDYLFVTETNKNDLIN